MKSIVLGLVLVLSMQGIAAANFVPLPEPGDRHCPSRSQCPGGGSK